ncbi:hypothetical protein [Undibacterium sp. Ren11W]|uniref:hypothetical protein n=1 Tax=Undibacterium sp. Ren11W TaxID=3413045 RepID=UPI003BF17F03
MQNQTTQKATTLLLAMLLCACSTTTPQTTAGSTSAATPATAASSTSTVTTTATTTTATTTTVTTPASGSLNHPSMDTQVMGAVTSPLSDFNLMRTEISPELTAAMKGPYLLPSDKSCESIAAEVRGLDRIIGPDLDATMSSQVASLFDQGQSELSNAAVGALRSTVEGVIPFRSWVRRFSGADKHSKELSAALAAGIVRRAFLKGLGQASGCLPPAAPLPLATVPAPVAVSVPANSSATTVAPAPTTEATNPPNIPAK